VVPNMAKKRLALSGLVVGGSDPVKPSGQAAQVVNTTEGEVENSDVQSGPSERILRRGMQLNYGLAIYNATVSGGAALRPQLEGQVIVLRDGKAIYTSQSTPIDLSGQTDWKQVVA